MPLIDTLVDQIYQNIKDEVKSDWKDIEKIRYIYLKVGSYVEKNTDFFLNSKLDDLKLNDEEIRNIYFNNDINERSVNDTTKYQIICKSAAYLLKKIYEKFNIESEYIKTFGSEDDIRHWFLVVKDEDKQYFLTLVADLPFIKNSFPTRHFANGISFFKTTQVKSEEDLNITNYEKYNVIIKDGTALVISIDDLNTLKINTPGYITIKLTGNFLNNYRGSIEFLSKTYNMPDSLKKQKTTRKIGNIEIEYEEIAYENLNAKTDELYEIDKKIGYEKLYDASDYINDKNYKELFYLLREENSIIYDLVRKSLNMNIGDTIKIDDINEENISKLYYNFCKYLSSFMNQLFNTNKYNEYNFLRDYIEENGYQLHSYHDVLSCLKKIKKDKKGTNEAEFISNLQSCLLLVKRFENVVSLKEEKNIFETEVKKALENYKLSNEIDKEKEDYIYKLQYILFDIEKRYDKAKEELSYKELSPMLSRIAYYFINNDQNEISTIKDGSKDFVPLKYIYDKFLIMMPFLFEWNNGLQTDFSKQSYSEQVVIVKELLKVIYSELSYDNCSELPNYNPKYSPIENRIRIFPMKNKLTGEYIMGFRFWASDDEDEVSLTYIPSLNKLCQLDALNDRDKYITISNSHSLIDDLEDIEEKKI